MKRKVRIRNCTWACRCKCVWRVTCGVLAVSVLVYSNAEAGEVEVAGIVQRQAGVVGVFQSVLKLHLHGQTPTRAANHIRLLSVEETQWEFPWNLSTESIWSCGNKWDQTNISDLYLVPEMSIWACSTRSVVHTSSSPQSLKNWIWGGTSGEDSMFDGLKTEDLWCSKKATNDRSQCHSQISWQLLASLHPTLDHSLYRWS